MSETDLATERRLPAALRDLVMGLAVVIWNIAWGHSGLLRALMTRTLPEITLDLGFDVLGLFFIATGLIRAAAWWRRRGAASAAR